jgi:hypothetical protein
LSPSDTVFKLFAWAVLVMVVLQVVFYFVFQAIGYDSFLLSVTLVVSILVLFAVLISWRIMKKSVAR